MRTYNSTFGGERERQLTQAVVSCVGAGGPSGGPWHNFGVADVQADGTESDRLVREGVTSLVWASEQEWLEKLLHNDAGQYQAKLKGGSAKQGSNHIVHHMRYHFTGAASWVVNEKLSVDIDYR